MKKEAVKWWTGAIVDRPPDFHIFLYFNKLLGGQCDNLDASILLSNLTDTASVTLHLYVMLHELYEYILHYYIS